MLHRRTIRIVFLFVFLLTQFIPSAVIQPVIAQTPDENHDLVLLADPPVANFDALFTIGRAPLMILFYNQTDYFGQGATYLWDFGDGTSSNVESPTHTYTTRGNYTVTLTVTTPDGEDVMVKPNFVQVTVPNYLPVVTLSVPTRTFDNLCKSFPVNVYYGVDVQMTECVPSIENRTTMIRVNYTWMATFPPDFYDCFSKKSDLNNPKMYMTDQYGNRYDMLGAGGFAAYSTNRCMNDGYKMNGWFFFPLAKVSNPVFTFHDDDNHILLGPISMP